MATLLANGVTRSEHDPDLTLAPRHDAYPSMHTITGAFANPSLEVAFAAQLFRLAYQGHLLLLGMAIAIFIWMSLVLLPDAGAVWGAIILLTVLSLIGRVLLHRMPDMARSQQLGSWAWTIKMALDFILYPATTATCASSQDGYLVPILGFVIALINGSHGMGFLHKFALIGLMVVADVININKGCSFALVAVKCDIAALCVGSAIAHMAELQLRRSYAEKVQVKDEEQETRRLAEERRQLDEERIEQLQTSNERLLYDMQRHHGCPLDDDGDRSAIRRGLRAGPALPNAESSEAGAPSDSPPPSLPPGAPSSSSDASIAPPLTCEEDDRQHFAEDNTMLELAELAALVEMADDETVAALQNLTSSGHVSSTCSTAQAPHCGLIPAQANLQMAGEMIVAQPHALRAWDPSALQAKFHALVMCNFTPRNPRELPPPCWVSYNTLFHLFEPHVPAEVWQVGPGNLKQLITKWFQGHPAFAGLEPSVWCRRVTEQSRCIYKFSFEHTPQ